MQTSSPLMVCNVALTSIQNGWSTVYRILAPTRLAQVISGSTTYRTLIWEGIRFVLKAVPSIVILRGAKNDNGGDWHPIGGETSQHNNARPTFPVGLVLLC